uniref:Exonuclease VII small subunit n=1 Tax=uncultured organism MedDCM-OCT-S01-C81 TaxID=743603 RepID=D6PJL7_9ZZZZ|nr:hypothetical protein BACCAP_02027 [uncultured organism MedDCM-OCT-S01-C81]
MGKPEEKEMSFEAISARLEEIADLLEQGDAPLEDALSLFEEGVALARNGSERLESAERRIEQLLKDGRLTAFEDEPAEI